jgi:hypothetical protein
MSVPLADAMSAAPRVAVLSVSDDFWESISASLTDLADVSRISPLSNSSMPS